MKDTHSPITLANLSSIKLVSIFSCSSPPINPVYPRRVDPTALVFSLSSHRHSDRKKHVIHQMFDFPDLLTLVARCFIFARCFNFLCQIFYFFNHLSDDLRNITSARWFKTFFQMFWACVRWFKKMKHLVSTLKRLSVLTDHFKTSGELRVFSWWQRTGHFWHIGFTGWWKANKESRFPVNNNKIFTVTFSSKWNRVSSSRVTVNGIVLVVRPYVYY
jgi:hypothetical protein